MPRCGAAAQIGVGFGRLSERTVDRLDHWQVGYSLRSCFLLALERLGQEVGELLLDVTEPVF